MKLEIRKETKPDGDMFYHIYHDDRFLSGFWIGNHIKQQDGLGEEKALTQAKEYYNRIKENAQSEPIWEIIQSETIETPTNEPA